MNDLFNLTDFEIDVLKCISKHYPYSMAEIEKLYMRVRSFDKSLCIIEVALKCNLSIARLAREL